MEQFIKTLYDGNLEEAKTLYHQNTIDLNQITSENIKLYHRLIIDASDNGFIDIIKWLLEINSNIINDKLIMNQAFTEVCYKGYMEIALWLLSLKCIDIHFDNDVHFRFSCMGGQLEMAKWLLSLDKSINIHADNNDALYSACLNGHLDVAKWLYSLDGKLNISNDQIISIYEVAKRDLSGEVGEVDTWIKSLNNV